MTTAPRRARRADANQAAILRRRKKPRQVTLRPGERVYMVVRSADGSRMTITGNVERVEYEGGTWDQPRMTITIAGPRKLL